MKKMSEEDADDFEDVEFEELLPSETSVESRSNYPLVVVHQYAISPTDLTKFERAAILGKRANELANNCPPTISNLPESQEACDIAKAELAVLRLPQIIKREIPNWSITYLYLSVPDEFILRTPNELSIPEQNLIIRQRVADLTAGARSTLLPSQLAQLPKNTTPEVIARAELRALRIPGIFKRKIPGRGEITIHLSKKI